MHPVSLSACVKCEHRLLKKEEVLLNLDFTTRAIDKPGFLCFTIFNIINSRGACEQAERK